jgi:ubiquinone/menaquinone biosynthesis C-methylase UbiE
MPEMRWFERAFCQSAGWRAFSRKVLVPWALQGFSPSGHALEIGAGSGAMAAEILSLFPGVRVTATDFDEAMLGPARERLRPFADRVEVRQADATALPFDDDSFDSVFSFIMLHHVIKWEAALEEACRVLRPGGWLIGYDLLSTRLMRAFHQAEGSYHRMIELDQLVEKIDDLPLRKIILRPGTLGLVVRFKGQKAI